MNKTDKLWASLQMIAYRPMWGLGLGAMVVVVVVGGW